MIDQIVLALAVILILGIIWSLLKAVLKLTFKVFGCGLFLILVIGVILFLTTDINFF